MAQHKDNKERYAGMDGPRKLRAYLYFKGFKYRHLAAIMGTQIKTVTYWMGSTQRPNLVARHIIQYITSKDMDEPVMVNDWLTDKEKKQIADAVGAVRRARRQYRVEKITSMDEVKGRL